MFGAGSVYSIGEDTIFLADCFKRFLNVYTSDFNIGTSTKSHRWFSGYNDKFFFHKGALYRHVFGIFAPLYTMYYSKKYEKISGVPARKISAYMEDGIKDYADKIEANKTNKDGM